MAVWMVRAGKEGEWESLALEQGLVVVGWVELPDLSPIKSREALAALLQRTYPDKKPKTLTNWLSQLWPFRQLIQIGDLLVLPLKTRAAIAIGKVSGPYQYRSDLPEGARHCRAVQWLRKDIPRSDFSQDLLYSLGAFMTVCRIRRNQAEARIQAILEGKQLYSEETGETEPEPPFDLEAYAQDQVRAYIETRFKGHDLARLVNALLTAQGYQTYMSPPGPDGGVDIIAGRGPMGFDPPRLCVQVKSTSQPVDVKVLRELQGVVKNYGAQQGLLVSWAGFKQSVFDESRRLFFEVRLWDSGNVVRSLLQQYDQLPEDLQAELPLKRIWTLVAED